MADISKISCIITLTLMVIGKDFIVSYAGLKTLSKHFHKHRSVTTAQD